MRDLREDHDKTQQEIADILGTSQTMYARYERGANELPIRHLVTLCKYYGVSADYILTGKHNVADSTKAINNYNRLTPQQQNLVDSLISAILGE